MTIELIWVFTKQKFILIYHEIVVDFNNSTKRFWYFLNVIYFDKYKSILILSSLPLKSYTKINNKKTVFIVQNCYRRYISFYMITSLIIIFKFYFYLVKSYI